MPKWHAQYPYDGNCSLRLQRIKYFEQQCMLWEAEMLDPDNQYDDSDCPVDGPLSGPCK